MVEPKKWNERSHATLTSFLNVPYSISFPFFFFFTSNLQIKSRFISIFYLSRKKNRSFFFSLIHFSSNMESRKNRGCRAVEYKKCGGGGTRELYAIENNVACVFCF